MRIDEHLTSSEIILINLLKGKSRMEQDEIIGEWEDG
jgi:hypothetical protein